MAEEATIETPEIEEPEDNSVISDLDVPNLDDEGEPSEPEDKPKEKPKEEPENDKFRADFEKLQKSHEHASSHIKDLEKAIHGLRQQNKELRKNADTGDPEERLTPAQLAQIINDNKDDTGILVHAINELIDQKTVDAQKLVDKKVEISRKKTEVDNQMGPWKDYIEKNSDGIEKVIKYHGIGDHFAKEQLAIGAMIVSNWEKLVKQFKEEGKQEALNGISENSRKNKIKNNKPDIGDDNPNAGDDNTPSNWAEAADCLGLNKKQREKYYALMKKSSKKKES